MVTMGLTTRWLLEKNCRSADARDWMLSILCAFVALAIIYPASAMHQSNLLGWDFLVHIGLFLAAVMCSVNYGLLCTFMRS